MIQCLVQKIDEDSPDPIVYEGVRAAYDRIKERAEGESASISDYTIIPIEKNESL